MDIKNNFLKTGTENITGRITFELFQNIDAIELTRLANNINIASVVRDSFPFPYTIYDALCWIEFCKDASKVNSFQKAIIYEGQFVGGIGVTRQEDIFKNNGEIGYWLGEPYWSKGIMSEAVKQMTAWIFENTTIERLYAGVFSNNKASMRVLEKAGYDLEAIHKRAIIKEGKIFDEYFFVKFKD